MKRKDEYSIPHTLYLGKQQEIESNYAELNTPSSMPNWARESPANRDRDIETYLSYMHRYIAHESYLEWPNTKGTIAKTVRNRVWASIIRIARPSSTWSPHVWTFSSLLQRYMRLPLPLPLPLPKETITLLYWMTINGRNRINPINSSAK